MFHPRMTTLPTLCFPRAPMSTTLTGSIPSNVPDAPPGETTTWATRNSMPQPRTPWHLHFPRLLLTNQPTTRRPSAFTTALVIGSMISATSATLSSAKWWQKTLRARQLQLRVAAPERPQLRHPPTRHPHLRLQLLDLLLLLLPLLLRLRQRLRPRALPQVLPQVPRRLHQLRSQVQTAAQAFQLGGTRRARRMAGASPKSLVD